MEASSERASIPERAVRRAPRALVVVGLFGLALACRAGGRGLESGVSLSDEARVQPAEESLEVVIWRAGRAELAGLAGGREQELEEQRSRALTELARLLRTTRAERRFAQVLASEDVEDELWCAAARAAASLERYGDARALADALESSRSARRRAVARESLHELYGRWFSETDEVQPFLDEVRAGPGTRLLVETSAWEESRSRQRLFEDLAHEPASAAAWLEDPDPEVRSGAARTLGEMFGREDSDPVAMLDLFLLHLERELDPGAFHEALAATMRPLERAEPAHPALVELREILAAIGAEPGDERSLSVALALTRMPWKTTGAKDDPAHLFAGIEVLGEMLRGLAEVDRRRGANDPDPLVGALAALRGLSDHARAAGLGRELSGVRAREPVFAILEEQGQDEAVRAAAAGALGPLLVASDCALLAGVLEDELAPPAVKHALLGALRPVLPELDAEDAGAQRLLRATASLTAASDPDLRRRAYVLLADEGLVEWTRRLDPTFLVDRLAAEQIPEISREILRLIQRFAQPQMLGELLSLERFDELASEHARLEELAAALRTLSHDRARETLAAAKRLASVRSPETHLAALRHALGLVAALDEKTALELRPDEHRAIASWAWRLHQAGVSLREAVPHGVEFERRLLDVHLLRSEDVADVALVGEGEGFGAFERAHLCANLRADLLLAGEGRVTKPQVEMAFETAFSLAPDEAAKNFVLRDRARFRSATDECVKALADYRKLAAQGVLEITDLRTAVELLERIGGTGARSDVALETYDLRARLVERASWRAEPAAVRMQDVRDLVACALASRDRDRIGAAERALADLPLTQNELPVASPTPPLWYGLIREPAWFQELLDLRTRLRIALRELGSA